MRKLLISIALSASLSACSSVDIDKDTWDVFGNVIPESLEKLPFVYRPQIIQGNLITQDNVNMLRPGMHKKQVQLVMGTALIQDIFHDNRWDYYYGMGIGHIELEKHLTLYFEDDKLARIVGDYQPLPPIKGEGAPENPNTIITVPDWQPPHKTLFEEVVNMVGLETEDTEAAQQVMETEAQEKAAKEADSKPADQP